MALQFESNIAFKEWASVVSALQGGKQILILRKGGIREETGEFQMEHREFFLFPTYEHQSKEDLKPEAHRDLELVLKAKPNSSLLSLQCYAQVVGAIQMTDEAELESLRPFHVWSDEAIKKRFHYGRKEGLYVIAVRVFQLPSPQTIEVTPEYAGCKSWVYLKESLKTNGAQPVLSEAVFHREWQAISAIYSSL
ncbi:MAG: DUF1802 family protein [Candidatus Omnitrophica bacterium]|nr:DUF1802 family protein [Candidatus Omnitrophota bacterium]